MPKTFKSFPVPNKGFDVIMARLLSGRKTLPTSYVQCDFILTIPMIM